MQLSKLWGRGNDHRSEDPRQLLRTVILASDLLDAFMTVNEGEIDAYLLRREVARGRDAAPSTYDDYRRRSNGGGGHRHRRRHRRATDGGNGPDLCTEILCQAVCLGWSRCDPSIAVDAGRNSHAILHRLECLRRRRGRLPDTDDDYNDVNGAGAVSYTHLTLPTKA